MRKLLSFLLVLLVSTMLVITGCGNKDASKQGNADKPQVYTLKIAHWYPTTHTMFKQMETYAKRLEELSGGRIKVEHFPAGQLGKITEMLELGSKGTADITLVLPTTFAGQLPLNTVTNIPFWTTSVEGTEIYERTFAAVPELVQEYARYGLRHLASFSTNQYDVGTVKKQVKSPEDLKGLKLASSGGFMNKIAAKYGVTPMSIVAAEKYEATQKHIIDGNIYSHPNTDGYKLYELQKYLTNGLRMGGVITVFVINENSWQKLPGDLQKVVLQASQEAGKNAAVAWDKQCNDLVEKFKQAGVTVYNITPEDRVKWDAPLQGIEQDWINDMNAKGLPGQKVFDEFNKASKQVVK